MIRVAILTEPGWEVKERNRDRPGEADQMNLEVDSKGEVMHIWMSNQWFSVRRQLVGEKGWHQMRSISRRLSRHAHRCLVSDKTAVVIIVCYSQLYAPFRVHKIRRPQKLCCRRSARVHRHRISNRTHTTSAYGQFKWFLKTFLFGRPRRIVTVWLLASYLLIYLLTYLLASVFALAFDLARRLAVHSPTQLFL